MTLQILQNNIHTDYHLKQRPVKAVIILLPVLLQLHFTDIYPKNAQQ